MQLWLYDMLTLQFNDVTRNLKKLIHNISSAFDYFQISQGAVSVVCIKIVMEIQMFLLEAFHLKPTALKARAA